MRQSVSCSEVTVRMLVSSQHLCNVVTAGALGIPDLGSSEDRGADRSGGVKDENGLWLACRKRKHKYGWTCPRHQGNAVFCSFEQSDVGSLPITDTQKSYWNEKTTSLSGTLVFDPARCAHLAGNELKIDCLSSLVVCPHSWATFRQLEF